MIVQLVRFTSGLAADRVNELYRERAPRYRALDGLVQKYYLRFPATGEHGAVYVWESEAALEAFRRSDLGRTIASAYEIKGVPESETADVLMTLRADTAAAEGR